MNLKAKIKLLQGIKNVSLQKAILRSTNSNSQSEYTYMCVLPSVGIYVTLSLLLNMMYLNLVVILSIL